MKKIVKVTDDTIFIGDDNGKLIEVDKNSVDFVCWVGQEVEVYKSDDNVLVIPKQGQTPVSSFSKEQYSKEQYDEDLDFLSDDDQGRIVNVNLTVGIIAFLGILSIRWSNATSVASAILASLFLTAGLLTLINLIFIIIYSFGKKDGLVKKAAKYFSIAILVAIISGVTGIRNYGSTYTQTRTTSSQTTSEDTSTIDTDESNYSTVDYNEWNHNKIDTDEKVKISGEVVQVQKSSDSYFLRVATADYSDNIVLVEISSENYSDTIADDDIVTIYGLTRGTTTYTAVLGNEITVPAMDGLFYTIDSYGDDSSDTEL